MVGFMSEAARGREITDNLQQLVQELPPAVSLIAVSKTFPFSDIQAAWAGGQRHFGENKVQELALKAQEAVREQLDIAWHFIGRLQKNKIKKLLGIPGLVAIHSIDSLDQIQLLRKFSALPPQPVQIFIQVNTSEEASKGGFTSTQDLSLALAELAPLAAHFPLAGLMTVSAIGETDFARKAEQCFTRLRSLRDRLGPELKLSMGMGLDYPLALAQGADYVRIGQKIFGPRNP